eukprot:8541478-Heterocapsa_arctica.AAC.1
MATLLLHACQGAWERIGTAYRSLLLTPGTLAIKKGVHKAMLVVQSTRFGFLGWRVKLSTMPDGHKVLDFGSQASQSVVFDFVER